MAGIICLPLNICAPKPHQRRVPCFAPSPCVPMRSWFGRINGQPCKACSNTTNTLSETELRAAQPNLHSGRLRSLLQVAARYLSAERRRNIKQARASCASAEFLRPCRVFSECSSPLGYVSAILKTFVEMLSQSRMMRGRYSFGHGGGKPEGKEGEIKITRETRSIFGARPSTKKPPSEDRGFDTAIREIAPSVT